jgi:hypothetical protein
MKIFSKIKVFIPFFYLFIFFSCGTNEAYEKQIRSLDSLSGALNQKLAELKQVDTVILEKAIGKYRNYKAFIGQNLNDTVTKEEADHLQHFYICGKNLFDFSSNRKTILGRGNLMNSQLAKLQGDARNKSMEEEKLRQNFSFERSNAEELIKRSVEQQQRFLSCLQEFKLSLTAIENLIRSRNSGQMPVVIKDSIPL